MADTKPYKRKLRNYLINRHLQVRYTLLFLTVAVALYAILGVLFYREIRTQDAMLLNLQGAEAALKASNADPEEVALLKAQMEFLGAEQGGVAEVLWVALFGLVSVLFLGSIYMTHRIAGPIHAVYLYLHQVAAGEWRRMRPFRKGDEFAFLHESLDLVYDALTERERNELAALEHVRGALNGNPAQLGARAEVERLIEEKQARLRSS
jgi:hypothetical protein